MSHNHRFYGHTDKVGQLLSVAKASVVVFTELLATAIVIILAKKIPFESESKLRLICKQTYRMRKSTMFKCPAFLRFHFAVSLAWQRSLKKCLLFFFCSCSMFFCKSPETAASAAAAAAAAATVSLLQWLISRSHLCSVVVGEEGLLNSHSYNGSQSPWSSQLSSFHQLISTCHHDGQLFVRLQQHR